MEITFFNDYKQSPFVLFLSRNSGHRLTQGQERPAPLWARGHCAYCKRLCHPFVYHTWCRSYSTITHILRVDTQCSCRISAWKDFGSLPSCASTGDWEYTCSRAAACLKQGSMTLFLKAQVFYTGLRNRAGLRIPKHECTSMVLLHSQFISYVKDIKWRKLLKSASNWKQTFSIM